MTTPTPAAQKAAEAIAEQLSRTGWNIEDREKLQYAAIIEREMNQWRPISEADKSKVYLGTWAHTWKDGRPHIETIECGEEGFWFFAYDGETGRIQPTHFREIPQLTP